MTVTNVAHFIHAHKPYVVTYIAQRASIGYHVWQEAYANQADAFAAAEANGNEHIRDRALFASLLRPLIQPILTQEN